MDNVSSPKSGALPLLKKKSERHLHCPKLDYRRGIGRNPGVEGRLLPHAPTEDREEEGRALLTAKTPSARLQKQTNPDSFDPIRLIPLCNPKRPDLYSDQDAQSNQTE
ncbi:hypothetical protein CRG98_043464 [Punica granatum]|uniref:Uncharacterized protein n=1 Tax=Punica granatum TaxID=22663 RepID=A0A2I0HWT9_PUNGR|nr:hypothetical protein CRG98_043464 [Punica granatum]